MNLARWFRAAVAATVLISSAVFADCGPSPGGPPCAAQGMASGARGNDIAVGAGNPINLITGNKYQHEVDMAPLPGELGLEIVRHYNSSYSGPTARLGLVGRGWRLSYETRLHDTPDNLQIIQADGTLAIFPRDPQRPNLCTSLNPLDGKVTIEGNGKARRYVWQWINGRSLHFDGDGNLVTIRAPSGAAVLLWYGTDGLLTRVADPQGRDLTLEYGKRRAPGFHGVVAINTPVGRFTYRHPAPDLKALEPNRLVGNLISVKYPASTSGADTGRIYHYEDQRFPTLLTGISLIEGSKSPPIRLSHFGYDSASLAVTSSHADGVNKVTIARRAGGTTVVTNSLGKENTFRHPLVAGEHRLLEARGPGCAGCAKTDMRYAYDLLGRPVRITRLTKTGDPASTLQIERDDLGRPVKYLKIEYLNGKAQPPRLLSRTEYDGGSLRPMLVARPSVIAGKEHTLRFTYNTRGQVATVTEAGFAPVTGGQRPLTRTTTYRYVSAHARSMLSEIDGPLPNGVTNTPADSDITRVEWDAQARFVTRTTLPGGKATDLRYDNVLRVVEARSSDGLVTNWAYDNAGNTVSIKQGDTEQRARFGADGRLIETGIAGRDGYRAQRLIGYDTALRPAWTVSQLGIAHRWTLDTEDRLLDSSVLSSRIKRGETFSYHDDGRLASITDQNGGVRTFRWGETGLLDTETDTLGRLNVYAYRGSDLASIVRASGDPLAELRIKIDRDPRGNPRSIVADGVTTSNIVDDFGRAIETISADSGRTVRHFDAADRLIEESDAIGNRAVYKFDVAGRVTHQYVHAAGSSSPSATIWRYAGALLVGIEHPEQSERFEYDAQGRQVARHVLLRMANGKRITYSTRHAFNERGHLLHTTLPDGSALHYRRNAQDQVIAVDHERPPSGWLNSNLAVMPLARDIERDVVGLKRFVYGNGIEARFERSPQGALARVAYRRAGGVATPPVMAKDPNAFAGAMEWPADKGALFDTRYLWDTQGNLRERRSEAGHQSFAFDGQDRLIAAASTGQSKNTSKPGSVDRYFYGPTGNRLLSQEDTLPQAASVGTVKAAYAEGSGRTSSLGGIAVDINANGQTRREREREYVWDALGRLSEIRQAGRSIARYRYNHRGERIEKRTSNGSLRFLYGDMGKVSAELDEQGRIKRQYTYLGDVPLAVIDTDSGVPPGDGESDWARFTDGLALKWNSLRGAKPVYTFLHNNHLGAAEMATDEAAAVRWRGHYANFGALRVAPNKTAWTLNLRLPGQYFDAESGLHYNVHRYYDPKRGHYLSPDPLGLRGGINSYAYAGGNPLTNIDPLGLILFAFDGTGNGETARPDLTISNVRKFYLAYDEKLNGKAFYITGIGTTNKDMLYKGDEFNGDGFQQRVDLAFRFLEDFIDTDKGSSTVDIDVVGFSRGAAEARAWLNLLVPKIDTKTNVYSTAKKSRCLNLRFAGLWDTVPHLGLMHGDEAKYTFAIPPAVKFAAHAVALNEHRSNASDFDLRSIRDQPNQMSTAARLERGFIGAHSDIGGGYGTGDLSNVALMWMLELARKQGIKIDSDAIKNNRWDTVANPIIHDGSINYGRRNTIDNTRIVVYGDKKEKIEVLQTNVEFDGVSSWGTLRDERNLPREKLLIHYYMHPRACSLNSSNPDVGLVNMAEYKQWLDIYQIPVKIEPIKTYCRR